MAKIKRGEILPVYSMYYCFAVNTCKRQCEIEFEFDWLLNVACNSISVICDGLKMYRRNEEEFRRPNVIDIL